MTVTLTELKSYQWKCSLCIHLVPFSNASCPLRFYQYSGDRASHYAAPTTLALSPLLTDRPAIVPATVQCALTLNSLAGCLPVSASSRNTRRLSSHEGNLVSTCHGQWHPTQSLWNVPPEPPAWANSSTSKKWRKVWNPITVGYSHNLMPGLDVDSQYLKWHWSTKKRNSEGVLYKGVSNTE